MAIDTDTMISITEANQNFSKAESEKIASTEDVVAVSERLIRQNMVAYKELAK